jgi:outer membrane protein
MTRFIPHALAGAALLALCGAASAQSALSGITLSAGVTYIAPHSSASDAVGPFTPPGVSLEVKNQTTLYLSAAYAFNPNVELQLAAGYPPTHDVNAKIAPSSLAYGTGLNGQKIARVRQVAPTLFLNYRFGDAASQWRPFVGLGINYTKFDKRTSTAANNALNGGPTDIDMTDSWGLAGQIGLSSRIDDHWSLSGSLATARVKSKITTTTAGIQRNIDIRFHPTVLTIAAGYSF